MSSLQSNESKLIKVSYLSSQPKQRENGQWIPQLNSQFEERQIKKAIPNQGVKIQFNSKHNCTAQDLQFFFTEPVNILHISGHGVYQAYGEQDRKIYRLLLEDQNSQIAAELSLSQISKLCKVKKMIELVILMSCHSQHAAELLINYKLANHVIYIQGNSQITNGDAGYFSSIFYKKLFRPGMTICQVFRDSKREMTKTKQMALGASKIFMITQDQHNCNTCYLIKQSSAGMQKKPHSLWNVKEKDLAKPQYCPPDVIYLDSLPWVRTTNEGKFQPVSRLDIDLEFKQLFEAAVDEGVEIKRYTCTLKQFIKVLFDEAKIVLFAGHGIKSSQNEYLIQFENEFGRAEEYTINQIEEEYTKIRKEKELMGVEIKKIELFLLVSCHSKKMAELLQKLKIAKHIVYVSGEYIIDDNVARIFTVRLLKEVFEAKSTYCDVIDKNITLIDDSLVKIKKFSHCRKVFYLKEELLNCKCKIELAKNFIYRGSNDAVQQEDSFELLKETLNNKNNLAEKICLSLNVFTQKINEFFQKSKFVCVRFECSKDCTWKTSECIDMISSNIQKIAARYNNFDVVIKYVEEVHSYATKLQENNRIHNNTKQELMILIPQYQYKSKLDKDTLTQGISIIQKIYPQRHFVLFLNTTVELLKVIFEGNVFVDTLKGRYCQQEKNQERHDKCKYECTIVFK